NPPTATALSQLTLDRTCPQEGTKPSRPHNPSATFGFIQDTVEGSSERELPCQTHQMYLSCSDCIRLVVTQKSFVKCWRVMFAGRLLTDFRPVASTWVLKVCFVIFLVASSQTLTNSSRTAPSSSSQANMSSPSAAIQGVLEGVASGSPLVSLTCGHCKTG